VRLPPSRRAAFAHAGIGASEVMTDNAKNYTLSAVFQSALAEVGAAHVLIRPHCPWQNGKVERLTGLSRSSGLIAASIAPTANGLVLWLRRYNTELPQLPWRTTPISRLSRT